MKKSIAFLIFIFIFTIFCGCNQSELNSNSYEKELSYVELAEINDINLNADKITVSDNDVDDAIDIYIRLNEILIPKNGKIDYGDVVNIDLSVDSKEKEEVQIEIGESEIETGIDEELIGLTVGETKKVLLNNKCYKIIICNISNYPTSLSDEIIKTYFGYKTLGEFKEYIKQTIYSNRIKEEAYYQLIYNSSITNHPSGIDTYIEKMMSQHKETAANANLSLEEYIKNIYEVDTNTFKKDLEEFYYEMLIVNSFALKYNFYPTQQQIDDTISDISIQENCSTDEVIEKLGIEYVIYTYNYDLVCTYLLENVNVK